MKRNAPAYPCKHQKQAHNGQSWVEVDSGLTKREYIIIEAMKSFIIASPVDTSMRSIAIDSIRMADILIEEFNGVDNESTT